jgi:hypothetical protein
MAYSSSRSSTEKSDPDPSVELRLNEAFALEQSERLAHWSATDPEVVG